MYPINPLRTNATQRSFHDRDIAPEGATLAESNRNLDEVGDK